MRKGVLLMVLLGHLFLGKGLLGEPLNVVLPPKTPQFYRTKNVDNVKNPIYSIGEPFEDDMKATDEFISFFDEAIIKLLPPLAGCGTLGCPHSNATGKEYSMFTSDFSCLQNLLGFVRDIKVAKTNVQWSVLFKVSIDDCTGVRVTVLPQSKIEVITAQIPSIRQVAESDSEVRKFTMPLLVARREGKPLKSTFLAVYEPYSKKTFIKDIKQIDGVLIVKTDEFTDIHLFNKGNSKYQLKGRYGFICMKGGVIRIGDKRLLLSNKVNTEGVNRLHLLIPNGTVYFMVLEKIKNKGEKCEVVLKDMPNIKWGKGRTGGVFMSYSGSAFKGALRYKLLHSKSFYKINNLQRRVM